MERYHEHRCALKNLKGILDEKISFFASRTMELEQPSRSDSGFSDFEHVGHEASAGDALSSFRFWGP